MRTSNDRWTSPARPPTAADSQRITRFHQRGGGLLVARDHQDFMGCSVCALGDVGRAHFFHARNRFHVHKMPTAVLTSQSELLARRAARTSLFGSAPPGRWPPNDVGGSGGGPSAETQTSPLHRGGARGDPNQKLPHGRVHHL